MISAALHLHLSYQVLGLIYPWHASVYVIFTAAPNNREQTALTMPLAECGPSAKDERAQINASTGQTLAWRIDSYI
jgi:hypothetical protein